MSMIRIMIRSTIRSRSMIRNNACNSVVCSVVIYYYSVKERRKKEMEMRIKRRESKVAK